MGSEELKPCWSCDDSKPGILEEHRDGLAWFTAMCACHARTRAFVDRSDAVEAWNTRPLESAAEERGRETGRREGVELCLGYITTAIESIQMTMEITKVQEGDVERLGELRYLRVQITKLLTPAPKEERGGG